MTNTAQSFHDKWHNNQNLAFDETSRIGSDIYQWILTRNGFVDNDALTKFLCDKKRILDAGCGNGRVTNLLQQYAPKESQIVGVDLVAADVAKANLAKLPNVEIHAHNILEPLSNSGLFDFIYCQEVLHHTEDPRGAFLNLCQSLNHGGEIAIYVYKQKAPIREFTDDYVRGKISGLSYEDAMKAAAQITEFGKRLHDLDLEVDMPAVDVLEIPEGRYSVQRLFYHFFMKCYWNPDLSHHDNAAVNYDWYHPQLATRHTLPEVLGWFADAGLKVQHQHVDFYGITVRGKKA